MTITVSVPRIVGFWTPDATMPWALIALYPESATDVVATDDTKLARRLRANGIPYVLPALIIYMLALEKSIAMDNIKTALERLADYISTMLWTA